MLKMVVMLIEVDYELCLFEVRNDKHKGNESLIGRSTLLSLGYE